MGNGKIHVEIGMDGNRTMSVIDGRRHELLSAAVRCLNIFYQAFKRGGAGETFKLYIREFVNNDNSPLWTYEGSGMEAET